MRVRNSMMVSALVAAATVSAVSPAWAQGSSPPADPAPATSPQATPPAATPPAAASESLFTPPSVLGEAWAQALRTVIDGMKQSVDAERLEAVEALGARLATVHPRAARSWARPLIWTRSAWIPGHALRDAIEGSPVQLTPVSVTPPTETGVDTRGEHATLLGAKVELPWLVP